MLLPDQPNLSQMAKYIKEFSPLNLVNFFKPHKRRYYGTIYIGISPSVNEENFRRNLLYNLEYKKWDVFYKEGGMVATISKGKSRYNLFFYSTKLFRFIKKLDSVEVMSVTS